VCRVCTHPILRDIWHCRKQIFLAQNAPKLFVVGPAGGAYSAPSNPLAAFDGSTFKRGEGGWRGERRKGDAPPMPYATPLVSNFLNHSSEYFNVLLRWPWPQIQTTVLQFYSQWDRRKLQGRLDNFLISSSCDALYVSHSNVPCSGLPEQFGLRGSGPWRRSEFNVAVRRSVAGCKMRKCENAKKMTKRNV